MDPESFLAQQTKLAALFTKLYAAHSVLFLTGEREPRQPSLFVQRLNWERFIGKYKNTAFLRRHLRMKYESFKYLLSLIKDKLVLDEKMANKRGGVIIPEIHLYATIRYLGGASYSDVCVFCGISVPSFYTIVWRTIKTINLVLEVKFPNTPEECAVAAADFQSVSYGGIIRNCVSAVDGYLLAITTPPKKYAKNVRSYFSGHYQRYGINIQASCDAHCRFTFIGVGGPGVTKDRNGIVTSGLLDLVNCLPQGYVVIGDAAYQPSEKFVPVFGGDLATIKDNDNFNFYVSQLHIRIEMAFGLMTRKWGILQRPISIALPSIKHLICAICRLHNFCIDERLKGMEDRSPKHTKETLDTIQLAYMHAAAEAEHRDILSNEYPQWSLIRDEMVQDVKSRGLTRPEANFRKRRRDE